MLSRKAQGPVLKLALRTETTARPSEDRFLAGCPFSHRRQLRFLEKLVLPTKARFQPGGWRGPLLLVSGTGCWPRA